MYGHNSPTLFSQPAKPVWTPLVDRYGFELRGGFNFVFIDQTKTLIFKIQKEKRIMEMDEPERAVRVWNEIHSPPKDKEAYVYVDEELGKGWICPYIDGYQPPDSELASAVLEVFNRTGRIVVDAPSPRNFVKEKKTGLIYCVDIGFALRLNAHDKSNSHHKLSRRTPSIASMEGWKKIEEAYSRKAGFFDQTSSDGKSETVAIIKALLFICSRRSEDFNANFLKENTSAIAILEAAYNAEKKYNNDEEKIQRGEQLLETFLFTAREEEKAAPPCPY